MQHPVVSSQEWAAARRDLLGKEKELTHLRAALAQARRDLPWEAVEKRYTFESADGTVTLEELFGPCTQLIVYHFMFDPAWDEGCPHCSYWADNFDGAPAHLRARDVSFAAISRAPLTKLETYRRRMGWTFPWVSAYGSDFNYDYGASFRPADVAAHSPVYNFGTLDPGMEDREGISVFVKAADGSLYRSYSTYARGIDMVNGTYQFLDLVPKGRDEGSGDPQFWVRRHDEYDG